MGGKNFVEKKISLCEEEKNYRWGFEEMKRKADELSEPIRSDSLSVDII
jgi:hypothetical protein